MKRLALILTICLCLSVPCSALTFFQTDYDADTYITETVYEGDWLPLRELSSILPYTVEWKDRTVYVYADKTWEIKPDWYLPKGVRIENGVTYVTPEYMKRFLPGISFIYQGELYALDSVVESTLIRGSERFKQNAITSLYWMKLATPDEYDMVRKYLTGGIESVELRNELPFGTSAYVYPHKRNPIGYIIGEPSGSILAERITHEAYHVYQYRNCLELDEKEAEKIGHNVSRRLLES